MKERMRSEQLFRGDGEIGAEINAAQVEVARINAIQGENAEGRRAALEGFLAGFGAGSVIRPPFYCDLGDGITIGERTFINSTCTMLDTGLITVGSECHIATGVHLITATHPIDPVARRAGWEMAYPVTARRRRLARSRRDRLPGRHDRRELGDRRRRRRHP